MNRKSLLLFAAMLLTAIASWADEEGRIILSHAGKATYYNASEIDKAINDAEKGDTVFLSKGTYVGFTLFKEITVRGIGWDTKVMGGVTIGLGSAPTLTEGVPLLEGLNVQSTLSVTGACTNFLVRFCHFNTFTCDLDGMNNAMVDRCDIGTFNISGYMTDFYVRNTYIDNLSSTNTAYHNQCNFINCDIKYISSGSGRFQDCIFYEGTIYSSLLQRCMTMRNAGVHSSSVNFNESHNTETTWPNSNAYINGARIGTLGGKTPYVSWVVPYGPKEASSQLSVNDAKKTIDVTLSVSPN